MYAHIFVKFIGFCLAKVETIDILILRYANLISIGGAIPMQNILLIINPVSGRQKSQALVYSIINYLSQHNCKTLIFATTAPGNATELVHKYAHECTRIICCGGDGTLNEIFSGVANLPNIIPVGYIPTGTTNDLAHALGLASNIRQAIQLTLHGKLRLLDLGTFNSNKYFSYVASFGAFSNVAYDTPQWLKNRLGRASYFFYGLAEIADIRAQRVKIVADDTTVIEDEFVYGSVSNSTVIGGIVKLPQYNICLSDGKFEVLLIKKPKTPVDLHHIVQGLMRQEYDEENVIFFAASRISFSFENSVPWTVDGEYAGESTCVNIGNMHKRIGILVHE